jgi:hypothetical protein
MDSCPATEKECRKCHRLGHFARYFRHMQQHNKFGSKNSKADIIKMLREFTDREDGDVGQVRRSNDVDFNWVLDNTLNKMQCVSMTVYGHGQVVE